MLIKILLLVLSISYLFFVYVLRTILIWRKTKQFPITYGNSNSAHDYVGKIIKILILLSLISIFSYIFSDQFYNYLLPFHNLQQSSNLQIIGLIGAYLSMVWIVIAQSQMGESWRIGIDDKTKTRIIKEGLFRYFRHPIYMGDILSVVSLFLIMPNVLTLIIFLSTYIVLAIQVRLEERFMLRSHGQEYAEYLKCTTRFFF